LNPHELPNDAFPEKWWKSILGEVKHVHFYNQLVVYEKGKVHKARIIHTVGTRIPYHDTGYHKPVVWDPILKKIQSFTGSPSWTNETLLPNPLKRDSPISKSVWDVKPLEHTGSVQYVKGVETDAFNPFMNVFYQLQENRKEVAKEFPELPFFDSWAHYQEGYHNHFHRFRGKPNVTFMEIGIQSGGKIGTMRDYFGPGFQYIGVDINNSTRMFDSADWIHVEIGDSGDRDVLRSLKKKYPRIDIFLDDGGHTMAQQMLTLEEMLPHIHEEGVFLCEDLSTSWKDTFHGNHFGGMVHGKISNPEFLEKTFFGLVHKTMDWLQGDWISSGGGGPKELPDDTFQEKWWKNILQQVKHIHLYNQFVVYEKGKTYKPQEIGASTSDVEISKNKDDSGNHDKPVDWGPILDKLQTYMGSPWSKTPSFGS